MRRYVVLALGLGLVLLATLVAAAVLLPLSGSFGELVLPGATDMQVHRQGWEVRMSYGLSPEALASLPQRGPFQPLSRAHRLLNALSWQLARTDWVRTIGSPQQGISIFTPTTARTNYTHHALFGLISENLLVESSEGSPDMLYITVTRVVHLPRWLRFS